MYACMYVRTHVCIYYVCMYYECMYVSIYLIFIFKHAPLLSSNTTCCNLHVSFTCTGCSDQHHSVSQCIPFTILKHTNVVKAVQLQLEMHSIYLPVTTDQSLLIL